MRNAEGCGVGCAFEVLLPEVLRRHIGELPETLTELRLRADRAAELVCGRESLLRGEPIGRELIEETAHALAQHSLYAREEELRQGFFISAGGCRAGVCGRVNVRADGAVDLTHISSLCIRRAREIKGAADAVTEGLYEGERAVSALVISPPGMGKTTLLRDIARQLSNGTRGRRGLRVAIADERGELAGCVLGVPALDVGERTDVMDGCPKRIAMNMLVRAMSPEVIVTDELGHAQDADAVRDALRCGVRVIASVHASSAEEAARRLGKDCISLFDRLIVLKGIGQIGEIVYGKCVKTGGNGT
jgi:stage III sporulation protein AA